MSRRTQVGGDSPSPNPYNQRSFPEWNGYTKGDSVKVRGRKGTFVFHEFVCNDVADWVTLWRGQFVSVRPEDIRRAK